MPPSTASDHLDLQELADRQTALRRVAELVAAGASPQEVLDAIVLGAYQLLDIDLTALSRYAADGSATIVAQHGSHGGVVIGMGIPLDDEGTVQRVRRTGRPVRVESYADVSGEASARAHRLALDGGAGAPIR